MITKFITANPILATLIIIAVIAIVYYMVKKAKGGQTNSPNNLAPSDPATSTTGGPLAGGTIEQRLHELRITQGQYPSLVTPGAGTGAGDPNAAKIADMATKSARNAPMAGH